MIVVRIKGGLGNQLFQYAIGYALSRRTEQPLSFDLGFTKNMTVRGYKLPLLNVECRELVEQDGIPLKIKIAKNYYINKSLRVLHCGRIPIEDGSYWLETNEDFNENLNDVKEKNLYLDGYFQSYKYFEYYRDDLIKQISPNYEPESEFIDVLTTIKRCNSVAVHCRRGDFTKDRCAFHYLLSKEYYSSCLDFIRENTPKPIFFWFSDDIEWVKSTLGENEDFRFISLNTKNPDIDELMLMKNCKHIITANSTFSWWAAWLNEHEDAIKICPAKPYGNKDMIPHGWLRM